MTDHIPNMYTVVPGQLSETVTAAVVGPGTAAAQLTVTLAGQVIDGGCVSLTVTVNVWVGTACDGNSCSSYCEE
ncbi:MAG: hypothetical protein IPF69_00075 [Chitinophagaceae bacterium]|nr:hypothetical protein [Chitinophagaceae bacterium]